MDDADYAQEREELIRRRAIEAALNGNGGEAVGAAPTERDCADCGAPIPAARLAACPNAQLCVQCQTIEEQHGSER